MPRYTKAIGSSVLSTRRFATQAYKKQCLQNSALPEPAQSSSSHDRVLGPWLFLAGLLVLMSLLGVITLSSSSIWADRLTRKSSPSSSSIPEEYSSSLSGMSSLSADVVEASISSNANLTPEEVYNRVKDAVVTIDTPRGALGSGVFINQSGAVLTNQHVVRDFSSVRITTANEQVLVGEVVILDPVHDLAVVQVSTSVSPACLPVETVSLKTGQVVYTLGSPLGMEQTFTNGLISRHSDTGEVLHTAPIAPGSSGSPLLDDQGNLVGINRAVITRFQAISIAVPVKAIQQLNVALTCERQQSGITELLPIE